MKKGNKKNNYVNHNKAKERKYGYWLYNDGYSCWGYPLIRYGQSPIEIDKETHNQTKEEKVKYWQDNS
jgi:hypothetical protein